MAHVWRDIPGYEGRYQACNNGDVRSLVRNPAKPRMLKPTYKFQTRKSTGQRFLRSLIYIFRDANGVSHEVDAWRPVYEAFHGKIQDPTMRVYHINGIKDDNRLSNLALRRMMVNEYHKRFRIPVARIAPDGSVEKWYQSGKQAALDNDVSRVMVLSHCKKRVKNEFYPFGFSFRYSDDI